MHHSDFNPKTSPKLSLSGQGILGLSIPGIQRSPVFISASFALFDVSTSLTVQSFSGACGYYPSPLFNCMELCTTWKKFSSLKSNICLGSICH